MSYMGYLYCNICYTFLCYVLYMSYILYLEMSYIQ